MESRREIRLDPGIVSYLEWRPAGDERGTVLLLHGGGLDSAALSWGELGPALAEQGFRVIAPDHPGFGHSPSSAVPATQRNLLDYVSRFVDLLGLSGYVVGGLSLGGGLSIGHALERPDGVRGVLLLASYGVMPRLTDGPLSSVAQFTTWVLLRTGLLGALGRWYARTPARLESGLAAIVRDPARRTAVLHDGIRREARRGSGLRAFEQWQRDQVLPCRLRTDYTNSLGRIVVPVLVVQGERDTGVPPSRAAAAAALLPRATLVMVPDAGHWVQRDRPSTVIPVVTDFLESLG